MRLTRLQRLLQLIRLVQSDRYYSVDELAEKLGISRRTAFRDLESLHKVGLPCYHHEELGGYKMDDSFFLPPLSLKLPEALALLLAVELGEELLSSPVQKQAEEAAVKIENVLPRHIRQQCGAALKHTSVHLPTPTGGDQFQRYEIFGILQQAIRAHRKVKMTYVLLYDRKEVETVLSPYHLHFADGAWHVIGHSSLHNHDHIFKFSRIKQVELLLNRYICEKPFRIDEFLGNAWSLKPEGKTYHVKLLFSFIVAPEVAESRWHRTQKLTWHEDSSLTFEVQVDGLNEITWWILGYGDQVEVLAPEALRRRIAQMTEKMTKIYQEQ